MKTRKQLMRVAALCGVAYGLLLGYMTGFPVPVGLCLGLLFGLSVGFMHSRHLP